ncbi:deoxyribodipyrimidine photo-lyase [Rhizobiaceae bacterium]|nr:deoxyribodipyrimidine photo-lyase [Rhizobiaceae bacterium]
MKNAAGAKQVVWFKRDLRIEDHAPLVAAAAAGTVVPLFIAEPDYWALSDTSYRHWKFLSAALEDLGQQVLRHGGSLCVRSGDAVQVLSDMREEIGPFVLHAHEETGNHWTFQRDERVREWCSATDTAFHETPQYGIRRGSKLNRDRWAKDWDRAMSEPTVPVPEATWLALDSEPLPDPKDLGLVHDGIDWMQDAGRGPALDTLRTFLYERGEHYQRSMSNPLAGADACSRLSVHLMAGSVSMRECYQAAICRQEEIAALPVGARGNWAKAVKSFIGRLHWHCHFIQKLEAEPELEWRPMARAYEGLRERPGDPERLLRFAKGQTGFPFVDACMRSLIATGWINFRMRAMLMSFASYDLWLPWQESGAVLARLFTDYEPGIHWTQAQMQSGETGINAVRIYSPTKQGHDQDPEGLFTKRWVPELAHLDGKVLQEPWTLSEPPANYPARIVEHGLAAAEAKRRIYDIRRQPEARNEAEAVYERHGSRKPRRLRAAPKAKVAT